MFDMLKLKLSTKFMRNMVSKLIAKVIYKKFGYNVDIQLKDLDISVNDGDANIETRVEIKIKSDEFVRIIKDIGLD